MRIDFDDSSKLILNTHVSTVYDDFHFNHDFNELQCNEFIKCTHQSYISDDSSFNSILRFAVSSDCK